LLTFILIYNLKKNPEKSNSKKIKTEIGQSKKTNTKPPKQEKIETGGSIKIGNQIWMTKNLDASRFKNGDKIPEAESSDAWQKAYRNKTPAWCYYNFDIAHGNKYGKLYNWYAVTDKRGIAPKGWHIPSINDWNILIGKPENQTQRTLIIGEWNPNCSGDNTSGFSALPGGYRYSDGSFNRLGERSNWWSSDSDWQADKYAWYLNLSCEQIKTGTTNKGCGFSVRCIKD
jgi:uncharacterized protein (TIGR02145 family)